MSSVNNNTTTTTMADPTTAMGPTTGSDRHLWLYIGIAITVVVIIFVIIIVIVVAFLIFRKKGSDDDSTATGATGPGSGNGDTGATGPGSGNGDTGATGSFNPTTTPTVTTYKTNQTYTPPADNSTVTHIVVEMVGSGGSGGASIYTGSNVASSYSYGGSAGGYLKLIFAKSELSKFNSLGIRLIVSEGGIPTYTGYTGQPAADPLIASGNIGGIETAFGGPDTLPVYFITNSGEGGSDTTKGGGATDVTDVTGYKDSFIYYNQFISKNGRDGTKFSVPPAPNTVVVTKGGDAPSYISNYGGGGYGVVVDITTSSTDGTGVESAPGQDGVIIISHYSEPSS